MSGPADIQDFFRSIGGEEILAGHFSALLSMPAPVAAGWIAPAPGLRYSPACARVSRFFLDFDPPRGFPDSPVYRLSVLIAPDHGQTLSPDDEAIVCSIVEESEAFRAGATTVKQFINFCGPWIATLRAGRPSFTRTLEPIRCSRVAAGRILDQVGNAFFDARHDSPKLEADPSCWASLLMIRSPETEG